MTGSFEPVSAEETVAIVRPKVVCPRCKRVQSEGDPNRPYVIAHEHCAACAAAVRKEWGLS